MGNLFLKRRKPIMHQIFNIIVVNVGDEPFICPLLGCVYVVPIKEYLFGVSIPASRRSHIFMKSLKTWYMYAKLLVLTASRA